MSVLWNNCRGGLWDGGRERGARAMLALLTSDSREKTRSNCRESTNCSAQAGGVAKGVDDVGLVKEKGRSFSLADGGRCLRLKVIRSNHLSGDG
jgi:hypothetical protein